MLGRVPEVNESPLARTSKRPEIDEVVACPECQSAHLVRDDTRGEVVCDSCGLVISEAAVDPGPEWSAFSAEEHDRLARGGAPRGYTSQTIGLTTVIPIATRDSKGNPIPMREREKYFRMRKLQRHSGHSRPGERSLPDTMIALDRVASALGLPRALKEQAGFPRAENLRNRGGRGVRVVPDGRSPPHPRRAPAGDGRAEKGDREVVRYPAPCARPQGPAVEARGLRLAVLQRARARGGGPAPGDADPAGDRRPGRVTLAFARWDDRGRDLSRLPRVRRTAPPEGGREGRGGQRSHAPEPVPLCR
ncbi:MAG: hypothetical protein E6K18_06160 [Methanobacteriota archaeon]|nr:MAG: hypothetical protein E6K18_06160 [Euryarchaeota archaeon]